MKTPLSGLSVLLPLVALSIGTPLRAQRSTPPKTIPPQMFPLKPIPTSAPAADCPIRPLITATLTSNTPRKFDYEMTPLGTPPITITVSAPPVYQPDNNSWLSEMRFGMRGLNGEMIYVPVDYHGRLVVVHFWASWCAACTHEMPYWVKSYQAFKDRGVAFVGIPVDRNRALSLEAVRTKAAQAGMTWPQSFMDAPTLSMNFHIKSLPAVFIVDGDTGRVLAQGNSIRGEFLAMELNKLLKQRGSPTLSIPSVIDSRRIQPRAIAPPSPPGLLEEIKPVRTPIKK